MVKLKVIPKREEEVWTCNFCLRGRGVFEIQSDNVGQNTYVVLCQKCGRELMGKLIVEIA